MTEQELTDVREMAMAAIRATTPMALMDRENQRVIEQTVRAVPALVAEVRRLQHELARAMTHAPRLDERGIAMDRLMPREL
jgi:hypothetical protein